MGPTKDLIKTMNQKTRLAGFSLIEDRAMVLVAVQQLSADCTAIFIVCNA